MNNSQRNRHRFTRRQTEVLKLIPRGMSSREVADELGISPKTVETHRADLMRRLELHNVVQLTRYAIERDLVAVLPAPKIIEVPTDVTDFECAEVSR